jgi:uncharacterized membrane protein YeaQ/YmgE (transglycosylase-associated protein family)
MTDDAYGAARPSLLAIGVAMPFLLALSLLRARGQHLVDAWPLAGTALTALVFVVPGIVAGAMRPRVAFLNGIVLGVIGAAFVTLQSTQFHQPNWSSMLVYESIGAWACIGVPLCVVGAAAGRWIARRY